VEVEKYEIVPSSELDIAEGLKINSLMAASQQTIPDPDK